MKARIILFAFSLLPIISQATVHTVEVRNNVFVPDSFSAVCGDTVTWIWMQGTHTVTSDTIPPCASAGHSWNVALHSASPIFSYIIPCAGQFNYKCNFHSMMTGKFFVSCNNGIGDEAALTGSPEVFPNPFFDELMIKIPQKGIVEFYCEILDCLGNVVKKYSNSSHTASLYHMKDFSGFPNRIYFLRMTINGVTTMRKLVHRQSSSE